MAKKVIFLIGAPGSGKTTDGKIVASECLSEITTYSLGDVLKMDMKRGGKIGKIINDYLSKDELVPSDLVVDELCKTVLNAPTDIVLIDGFPRELDSVKILGDRIFNLHKVELLSVIEIRVKEDIAKERYFKAHEENEERFNHLMKIYKDTISHIEEYYNKNNILKIVDGNQKLDEVVEDIKNYLRDLVKTPLKV